MPARHHVWPAENISDYSSAKLGDGFSLLVSIAFAYYDVQLQFDEYTLVAVEIIPKVCNIFKGFLFLHWQEMHSRTNPCMDQRWISSVRTSNWVPLSPRHRTRPTIDYLARTSAGFNARPNKRGGR